MGKIAFRVQTVERDFICTLKLKGVSGPLAKLLQYNRCKVFEELGVN